MFVDCLVADLFAGILSWYQLIQGQEAELFERNLQGELAPPPSLPLSSSSAPLLLDSPLTLFISSQVSRSISTLSRKASILSRCAPQKVLVRINSFRKNAGSLSSLSGPRDSLTATLPRPRHLLFFSFFCSLASSLSLLTLTHSLYSHSLVLSPSLALPSSTPLLLVVVSLSLSLPPPRPVRPRVSLSCSFSQSIRPSVWKLTPPLSRSFMFFDRFSPPPPSSPSLLPPPLSSLSSFFVLFFWSLFSSAFRSG